MTLTNALPMIAHLLQDVPMLQLAVMMATLARPTNVTRQRDVSTNQLFARTTTPAQTIPATRQADACFQLSRLATTTMHVLPMLAMRKPDAYFLRFPVMIITPALLTTALRLPDALSLR